jgi:hypothetical protein
MMKNKYILMYENKCTGEKFPGGKTFTNQKKATDYVDKYNARHGFYLAYIIKEGENK